MATSPSDRQVLTSSTGVPRSPFEIQFTKDALQKRIDQGDISQDDVEILKKAYQWMTFSTVIGSTLGVPAFIALRRRRPPMSLGFSLAAASAIGLTGTFLGFAMGGTAAALEVNNNMPDAGRKIKVFQQIVIDSKRAIEEARARGAPPTLPSSSASSNSSSSTYSSSESGFSLDPNAPSASGTPSSDLALDNYGESASRRTGDSGMRVGEIGQATQGTWDRIRSTGSPSVGAPRARGPTGSAEVEDERSREKREFEELLDRERRGVDEKDVWR